MGGDSLCFKSTECPPAPPGLRAHFMTALSLLGVSRAAISLLGFLLAFTRCFRGCLWVFAGASPGTGLGTDLARILIQIHANVFHFVGRNVET